MPMQSYTRSELDVVFSFILVFMQKSKSMTLSPNVADNVCGEMILYPGSSRSCCHRQHILAVYEVVNTKKFRRENV
jgi:hypothetical protein